MAIDRTNWTALLDDDGSNLRGTPWTKDKVKTVLLDPIDAAIAAPLTYDDRITIRGASAGSAVAVVQSFDSVTDTEHLVFQRADAAVRGSIKFIASTGHLNIGTTTAHPFGLKTSGTEWVTLSAAGLLAATAGLTVAGAAAGSIVATVTAFDIGTTTELLVFQRSDAAVRGSIQMNASTGHLNIGTTTNHAFDLKTNATVRIAISNAGLVQFPAYTAVTYTAGARYVVVDASGNLQVSAIGPGS